MMKRISFNKFRISTITILSFVMCSCGGSSGGGSNDADFEIKDLVDVDKVWYSNPYLSSSYDNDDAVIVYRFEGGGVLKRQQYSGRREETVGTWSLKDDVIEIRDKYIDGSATQQWFVQAGSTADYLKLNSKGGSREFTTSILGLDDVTADAYWVNDLRLVNGNYEADFRVDYEVFGKELVEVTAMFSASKQEDLVSRTDYKNEKRFVLPENALGKYVDDFSGAQSIRFYLKTKANDQYKLDEDLYSNGVSTLDSRRDYDQNTHKVGWKAIDESGIYYTIEILSSESNAELPLFRSFPQPANPGEEKSLEISNNIDAQIRLSDNIVIGDNYYVRISGIRYEEGIDPVNSINRSYNIQAKTIFTYKITW